MPLIIAVLIILVVIFNLKDSSKRANRMSAVYANTRRKTCAYMEQQILSKYLLYGLPFDEAFRKTYQDMVDAGFDPCIPKDAYSGTSSDYASTHLSKDFYEYDSAWVRDLYKSKWTHGRSKYYKSHPVVPEYAYHDPMEIYKEIHENFPTTDYEFSKAMSRIELENLTVPVGSFLIYPDYGTCEVVGYTYSYDKTRGWYKLRVLKTNEVVDTVPIGDSKITYQGSNIF